MPYKKMVRAFSALESRVGMGLGEKFAAQLIGPDGSLKQQIGAILPKKKFCTCCGETLTEVTIQFCTSCGHRYLIRAQEQDGKLVPVSVDLGEEKK